METKSSGKKEEEEEYEAKNYLTLTIEIPKKRPHNVQTSSKYNSKKSIDIFFDKDSSEGFKNFVKSKNISHYQSDWFSMLLNSELNYQYLAFVDMSNDLWNSRTISGLVRYPYRVMERSILKDFLQWLYMKDNGDSRATEEEIEYFNRKLKIKKDCIT